MQLNIIQKHNGVSPSIKNIIRALSIQGRKNVLLYAGKKFLEITKRNFGTYGEFREKTWKPLSKNYAKRIGNSTPTLLRTGELMNSIKIGSTRTNSIEIFTRDKRAGALAFGYKPNNIPPRNFWPIQNMGSPSYNRLMFNAEKEMFITISKRFNVLSSGVLPYQSTLTKRMLPSYGNPFTPQ